MALVLAGQEIHQLLLLKRVLLVFRVLLLLFIFQLAQQLLSLKLLALAHGPFPQTGTVPTTPLKLLVVVAVLASLLAAVAAVEHTLN